MPGFCHDCDILDPRSAHAWIIQARLDRQHLPDLEHRFLKTRVFMDLQSETVTRPVEKPNLPAVANFRRETAIGKELLYLVVQFKAVHAWLHFLQRELLPFPHRLPESSLRFTRAAAHHRPRHVAEVTALRVARKDVENNQRIRLQRPGSSLVRSRMFDASNSWANPSGKFAGTTAERTPRFRKKWESTFS